MDESAPTMNIFSLPDVFLRKLMRCVDLRDRMRLRLTCRAFERLVAGTHAGYFYDGGIRQSPRSATFSFNIGTMHFSPIPATDKGFLKVLRMRDRLFNGVEFSYFSLNLDNSITFDFLSNFTENFKISLLTLFVNSTEQLRTYRELMLTFPKRDHSLRLQIFPEVDLLMTLPRMDELYINDYITETGDIIFPWRINSDLFFNLLGKTKKLILSNVILSVEDCEKAVKIVSTAFDSKMVRVQLINSVITSWLHTYNVYQSSKEGQGYGEMEVVTVPETKRRPETLKLRYTNRTNGLSSCISIDGSIWENGDVRCGMTIYKD
ncbi:hypothetical protein PRIPAC_97957 [Pristionchus pacificus]|uniref:F-box domain-containing protein n=1 Tax=Pristionchus pacificus TaxID=54126 RepID=A0A2A6BBZ1_PRIPA|nr:hypothetical protein PRIPAC_97957 [Pristionchus pacificus]|eukprot:PDM63387.1 F-box domain-containing protein [Pristionchus pacificus]